MRPLYKGLIVALIHLLVVSTLGAKLLYDRSTRPRVWVRSAPVDPNLPIRGRYVRLTLLLQARGFAPAAPGQASWAELIVENGQLIAISSEASSGLRVLFGSLTGVSASAAEQRLGFLRSQPLSEPFRIHLDIEGGVVILSLEAESVAARAGLKPNDVIVGIDGEAVEDYGAFLAAVRKTRQRKEIPMAVLRDHTELSFAISWEGELPPEDATDRVRLAEPLAFFIPEHIPDPSQRPEGEELWVEVTVPRKGPPRPIRLGIRRNGGDITPLDLSEERNQ